MITLRNLGPRLIGLSIIFIESCKRHKQQYNQVYEVTTVQKAMIHVLVLFRCRKKSTEHNTNGNGSICYQNALYFTLEMCEKHKPEIRVSERHKPGFRVWQNERVSPGPGFSKTRVSIPSHDQRY